jgi:hypothetical protein
MIYAFPISTSLDMFEDLKSLEVRYLSSYAHIINPILIPARIPTNDPYKKPSQ